MTSKISTDPTWENINFDALERAATDDTYWQWIDESKPQKLSKPTKRRRGEHSTACKCPHPQYTRPDQYKPLSGEFGHGYRRLIKRDKKSGRISLRIRLSRHPYFVQMRRVIRRQLLLPIRRQLQWPLPHHHLDGFFATAFEVFFL